ncbi:MAG: beta-galactosidase [Chloroflexi bacterium]|nr:beta-galactosidase [Chloroflexota bacterium]
MIAVWTRISTLLRRIRLAHLLLLALAIFILWAVRPAPTLILLGPPQQVATTNPLVGVHTRLTDEVEEWKIQRTLQMVRQMGAPWIVEYFPWPYIEIEEGKFNWGHSDTVIQHAENQGLTVIARLGWVPWWARPDSDEQETTLTYLAPDHYDDFAAFVAAFVARYRGRVNHVIIWNEPNLSFEWGYRPVDPEGYVELLRAVYPRAHAANPDVVVLAGALAPTLEPEGSAAGLSDLAYLERMYQAGAGGYFDALAVHAYGLTFPPEEPPVPGAINFRRVELLREIMVTHGDGDKPIYVTEAGWNDHPRWANSVRPAERIEYTIGAYEWASQHWPWCECVAMWAFRYPASTLSYQDYYAFVTTDFEPKVIYLQVQDYTGGIGTLP